MTRQVRYGIAATVVVVAAIALLVADKALWAAGVVMAGLALVGIDFMLTDDESIETWQERQKRTGEAGVPGLSGPGGHGGGGPDSGGV